MSRRASYITLTLVGLVFLIGVTDVTFAADTGVLPDEVLRFAAVVLSGVAIGSILGGLRSNGNNGDSPDHDTTDRSRQSARIARQDIDDHDDGGD